MISRVTEFRAAVVAFVLLAAIFIVFPQIDLAASSLFFADGQWVLAHDSRWLFLPYRGMPLLGQLTVLTLLVLVPLSFLRRLPALRRRRATLAFLLAAALAGPVLLVDHVIKDHVSRARPRAVEAFGGTRQFTPAFIPSGECTNNCSFVSGHVASASYLMAFGWLGVPAIRRRWLLGSLAAAGVMGVARMLPGGHFLSDVVFAWFFVYFTTWGIELIFRRLGWLPPPSVDPRIQP